MTVASTLQKKKETQAAREPWSPDSSLSLDSRIRSSSSCCLIIQGIDQRTIKGVTIEMLYWS